jgi:ribosomal protein L24
MYTSNCLLSFIAIVHKLSLSNVQLTQKNKRRRRRRVMEREREREVGKKEHDRLTY